MFACRAACCFSFVMYAVLMFVLICWFGFGFAFSRFGCCLVFTSGLCGLCLDCCDLLVWVYCCDYGLC